MTDQSVYCSNLFGAFLPCGRRAGCTPYARSFRRKFFAYHHAVNHPHTNIILPWLSIPLVLKCAAKILKIGFRTKGMLNHDNTCMRVFHTVVIREKTPSKRPRKQNSLILLTTSQLILLTTSQWSVQQSARHMVVVTLTSSCLSFHRTMT